MKWKQWLVAGGTVGLVVWGLSQSERLDAMLAALGEQTRTTQQPIGDTQASSARLAQLQAPVQHTMEERVQERTQAPKEVPLSASAAVNEEQLLAEITAEAEKVREAPIDARVDRVWKAIPGYNGIEVDVEQTLALAKQKRGDEPISYIYREVEPKVLLRDLGAQPVYKGNPNKPMAALMINVAWGNEYIQPMLDVLEKEQVHATFFFDGSWLSKNIETARVIQEKGHEMSNHAYSHKMMSKLGREESIKEIERTQRLLKEELGVDNTLFAPPSGDFSSLTVQIAHEMNLQTILWTLDTVDWQKPPADSIVRKIAARVEPGSLILMHPTSSSSEALSGMIAEIKRKQLALGTVSELISPQRAPKVER